MAESSLAATARVSCWRNSWALVGADAEYVDGYAGVLSRVGVSTVDGRVDVFVPDQNPRDITLVVHIGCAPPPLARGPIEMPTGQLAIEDSEFGIIPVGVNIDGGRYFVVVSEAVDGGQPLDQTIQLFQVASWPIA